jgi:hypothetical protein
MDDEYEEWLAEIADLLNCEPEELEEGYSHLRSLLFDTGASASEAADAIRSGM